MKRMIFILLLCAASWFLRPSLQSNARCYGAMGERKLYQAIRRSSAAVVLLYHQERCKGGQFDQQELKQLKKTFSRLACSGYYPRKAIGFMELNTAQTAARVFARDNNICVEREPSIVIFSNGVPIEDQHGLVALTGNPTRMELKQFIDDYLKIDIAQYVQEDRAFKKYQDVVRDRMHVYYTPYFSKVANPWNGYWGWPYYGMSQGHYGGNAGVSFFGSNY